MVAGSTGAATEPFQRVLFQHLIDVAVKYGYDSPDSFAKAFQKFHGITPSQAREPGAHIRSFAPLHIKITLESGTMLDYRIVEKAPFTKKRAIVLL